METNVNQRIKEFIKENHCSVNSFSKRIGLPQVTVNSYILGNRKISLALVSAILDSFPELSAEWLLRGKGSMTQTPEIIEGSVVNSDGASNEYNSKETINLFLSEISEQRKLAQQLATQNATLIELIRQKNRSN